MVPPRDPPVAHDETGTKIDDGLGVGPHLAVTQPDAEVVQACRRGGVLGTRDGRADRTISSLRFVPQCRRGSFHQVDGIVARPADRGTTTDGRSNLAGCGRDRRINQGFVDHLRDAERFTVATNSTEQESESVLANPAGDINGSRQTRQSTRERSQNRRRGELTKRLDRVGHADDVDEHERARLAVSMHGGQRATHAVVE